MDASILILRDSFAFWAIWKQISLDDALNYAFAGAQSSGIGDVYGNGAGHPEDLFPARFAEKFISVCPIFCEGMIIDRLFEFFSC